MNKTRMDQWKVIGHNICQKVDLVKVHFKHSQNQGYTFCFRNGQDTMNSEVLIYIA